MATESSELDAPKALCFLIVLFLIIEMLASQFACSQ
jgi:hypothetical protein